MPFYSVVHEHSSVQVVEKQGLAFYKAVVECRAQSSVPERKILDVGMALSTPREAERMSLKATEVFVPGAYPQYTYVERQGEGVERALRDALDTPGQVVSLSGPSKSGKTVLVEKVVGRDFLITITGASVRSPDEVWTLVLDWMDSPTTISTSDKFGGKVGATAGGAGTYFSICGGLAAWKRNSARSWVALASSIHQAVDDFVAVKASKSHKDQQGSGHGR